MGAGYARQLLRARAAGKLQTDRIVVVDRDDRCVASALEAPVRLDVSEWATWLDTHLDDLVTDDHLVPYHWAPHLLRDWLTAQLTRRRATVSAGPTLAPRGLPFEGTTRDGDRALSYASWVCPPTCIEPSLCPHTRGPKDWSLAADLAGPSPADAHDARVVFRCLHLLYGVGTIPVRDIFAARDLMVAGLASGPRTYLIGTSSHCHALAGAIEVAPPA